MTDINFKTIMETELYDSADNFDNPVKMIKEGETVKVLQINLGDRFQFCEVEYQDKKYFMRAAFLDPVDNLFLADYKEKYDSSLDEMEERIGDIKVGVPYRKNNKIHIVIETGYFDKKELEDNLQLKSLENIKAQAADEILEYYGKNINAEDYEAKLLEFILSPFNLLEVGDFNYSTRPGKSIKIKFSIHEKYFDIFQDMSMEDFTIQNINTNFVVTNFRANELEKIIKDMSKILDKFDKASPKLTGSLEGANFKQLSVKSKRFLADFKKYAYENDIVISKDLNNKFELGFDKETGILKYVLFFDPVGRFLKIGMSYLCKIFDPDISRMIQDHKNILKSINCGLNPIDFGKRYIKGFEYNLGSIKRRPNSDAVVVPEPETSVMPVKEATDVNNSTGHPPTRREMTNRLRKSRDLIGDGFLIDLPDIILNIGDLDLLFELVLNKVSIKVLVDFLISSLGANLSLPELSEIKLRGVLMSLGVPQLLDVMFEFLELPELPDFGGTICDKYFFTKKEFGSLIDSMSDIDNIGVYFIHYREDGTLGGLIPDNYVGEIDFVLDILENNDVSDCAKLVAAIASSQLDFNKFYQEEMVAKILCQILTEGLPSFGEINECFNIPSLPSVSLGSLKIDLFDFFGTLDPPSLKSSIDIYFKERFKSPPSEETSSGQPPNSTTYGGAPTDESNVLRRRLLSIPSISFSLCNLELTNEKLLKRVDGIDLDFETKKIDSQFSFPSLQDINPSFDFTNFQFKKLDDIFELPMTSVEDAIKSGIEKSLLVSIKGVLKRVLDGLNNDLSELETPDFGSLSMPDLFNASNGTNFDFAVDMSLKRLQLSKKAKLANLCDGVVDLPDPKREDVEKMFEDISDSAKPLEVIRILKGQVNEKDYDNLGSNLSEPIASILDGSVFVDIFESLTDIVDFDMLEELEKAYDNEEVFASLCETKQVSYITGRTLNDNYANIKDKLRENYNNVTEEELDDIVEDLIDDVKDSMVEAIGIIKDNYNSILPFDENPCSFMPPQSSIPALNFVNDMVFDNIFDTIEKQYKNEASTLQDAFLVTTSSNDYVKMRLGAFDATVESWEKLDDGTYDPKIKTLGDIDPKSFSNPDDTIFNKEFAFNYFGEGTKLYEKITNGTFSLLEEGDIPTLKLTDGEWDFRSRGDKNLTNVYVMKQNPTLVPVPTFRKEFRRFPQTVADGVTHMKKILIETKVSSIQRGDIHKSTYEFKDQLNFKIQQYDDKSGEFAPCVDELIVNSLPSNELDIESLFKDHVEEVSKKSSESDYKYNTLKTVFDSFGDRIEGSSHVPSYVNPQKDLIPTLFYRLSQLSTKVLRINDEGVADSDLFELKNMLPFVIDNDNIDLLNIQDAKNAAKQEFNSNCSFAEDDKSLETSSIKHLISTMIRVQIIEEIVKNAFCNSNAYDLRASDAFVAIVWKRLNLYLESQKNAFLEKFAQKYLEAYGEEFERNSSTFSKTVKEIYADISKNFNKIFINSEEFLPKLAREFAYDVDAQNTRSYVEAYQDAYASSKKFFVQRVYRNHKKKEIYPFEYEGLNTTAKEDYNLFLRLSYIMKIGQDGEMPITFVGNYNKRELILQNILYKLKDSISHEYLINYNLGYSPRGIGEYYLLPLAETSLSDDQSLELPEVSFAASDIETVANLLVQNTGEETDVYNFLMNIMKVDHLKQSVIELYKILLTAEKPEISLIFTETKDTIKRNIETLDQDPSAFESQDKELDNLTLEQQSGISTTPEYSATARKMALMTVPLILKGFAEQFDPNIKIASKIRQGASLAGFDIPPAAASLMALPMNLVPFAPGPPIGPLGLLYLATSFLEPKERKRLADLKRGDNLNPAGNPDTGGFEGGGSLEEILEETSNLSEEAARLAREKFNEILDMTNDFMKAAKKEIQYLYDKIDQIVEDYANQPTVVIDVPDNSGGDPIADYFEYESGNTIFIADGFVRGAFGADGNIEFGCLADHVLRTVLMNMTTDREDLTTLFDELFIVFQLFFPAPKVASALQVPLFSGGHYDALTRYLAYCTGFVSTDTSGGGYKIDRFMKNSKFRDAKHVLRHMSRAQYVMENLCQYFMYEFFAAFEQNQDFLDNKYSDISNNYNRNFESYRIDLEQEDYNLYRKYILPSDHEDTSTADYQNFISNSGSRLDRAKKITETDSSGNTIGDNLYGVVGIFGNPIEEFAGLSMTNLFKELQTRYLQSLNQ